MMFSPLLQAAQSTPKFISQSLSSTSLVEAPFGTFNLTGIRPVGSDANSFLIAEFNGLSFGKTMSAPAGWTLLTTLFNTTYQDNIYYAPGTVTDFNFSFTPAGSLASPIIRITAWSGVDLANPIRSFAAVNDNISSTVAPSPTIPVVSGDLFVCFWRTSDFNIQSYGATPSGLTDIEVSRHPSSSNGFTAVTSYAENLATGNYSYTRNVVGQFNARFTYALALRPITAPGPKLKSYSSFSSLIGTSLPAGISPTDIIIFQAATKNTTGPGPVISRPGWNLIVSEFTAWGQAVYWAPGTIGNIGLFSDINAQGYDFAGTISVWSGVDRFNPIRSFSLSTSTSGSTAFNTSTTTSLAGDALLLSTTQQNRTVAPVSVGSPTVTLLNSGTQTSPSGISHEYVENLPGGITTAYSKPKGNLLYISSIAVVLAKAPTPTNINVTISQNSGASYLGVEGVILQLELPTTANGTGGSILSVGAESSSIIYHSVLKIPGLSNIPVGAKITSVSLVLPSNFSSMPAGTLVNAYALKVPFVTSQVSWNNRSTGVPWSTPGGVGSADILSTPVETFKALSGTNTYQYNSAAFVALVQSWVSDPSSNYGLLLAKNNDAVFDGTNNNWYPNGTGSTNGPVLAVTYSLPIDNTLDMFQLDSFQNNAFQTSLDVTLPQNSSYTNTNSFFSPTVGSGVTIQNLAPTLVTNTNSFFSPIIATGAVNLAPALYTNTNSFFSPTVATGAVNIAPTLVTNTQTLFAPSITTGAVNLSPSLYTNNQTFFAPTISVAAVNLAPTLVTNTNSFFGPSITTGAVNLAPTLVTNTNSFFGPLVSAGGLVLQPSLVTNTNSFFNAIITTGAVTISPSLVTNTSNIFVPTVFPGALNLSPSLVTNTQTFFAPTVATGAVNIAPTLVTNTQTLFAPSITTGAVNLSPSLVTNTNSFFSPIVSAGGLNLITTLVTNTNSFFSPTIAVGAVNLSPSLVTNTNAFFTESLTVGPVVLSPTLVTNTSSLFSPTVALSASPQTLAPSLVTNSQTFFSETVIPGAVNLAPTLVTNTQTFFSPSVTATKDLSPTLLNNSNSFFVHTITTGSVTLQPPLVTNSNSFFVETVTVGTAILAPSLITNNQAFFAPSVTTVKLVTAPFVTNTNSFFAPNVLPGGVAVSPGLLTNSNTFFTFKIITGKLTETYTYNVYIQDIKDYITIQDLHLGSVVQDVRSSIYAQDTLSHGTVQNTTSDITVQNTRDGDYLLDTVEPTYV